MQMRTFASRHRIGPVQPFNHQLDLEHIRDGCPALNSPEFERPAELDDPFAEIHLDDLPNEPYVLVRVRLPSARIADVATRARDLVTGLVDAADPESRWELTSGAAIFSEGGWWGSAGFRDPSVVQEARRRTERTQERTGEALAALDERLVTRLADDDEAAAGAIAERRWERAVAAATDPAQRIALSMRILERGLPVARGASETLRDSIERYLLEDWAFMALYDELFDAGVLTASGDCRARSCRATCARRYCRSPASFRSGSSRASSLHGSASWSTRWSRRRWSTAWRPKQRGCLRGRPRYCAALTSLRRNSGRLRRADPPAQRCRARRDDGAGRRGNVRAVRPPARAAGRRLGNRRQ